MPACIRTDFGFLLGYLSLGMEGFVNGKDALQQASFFGRRARMICILARGGVVRDGGKFTRGSQHGWYRW